MLRIAANDDDLEMPMDEDEPGHRIWGRFRFSVVADLLVRPPERGKLQARLEELAARSWKHPLRDDERVSFGKSTIERWYYRAKNADDPVGALARKVRKDKGTPRKLKGELLEVLGEQYETHPNWSFQLHYDNLEALASEQPDLGAVPTYATIRRAMKARGWTKKSLGRKPTDAKRRALQRREVREVRSFEVEHAHALWHLDFHHGSVRLLDEDGRWKTPIILAILDDHTRLICHLQWFFSESAEALVFGLKQAFLKRGLPRAIMSDNGSAMIAAETGQGLDRLGVLHETTLPHSPYQNGKQEAFWGQIEGRLLSMLQHKDDLDLADLNRATLAWAEMEYNRKPHEEIDATPMERLLGADSAAREAPPIDEIDRAFTKRVSRKQRQSDGTITIDGVRFEVPSRLRTLQRLTVRYARWDLARAFLVDPDTDVVLARIRPVDKRKNADARRATVDEPSCDVAEPADQKNDAYPPLMRRLLADWAQTGLPPAYLPFDETEDDDA